MSGLVEPGYDAIAERYLVWSLENDWPARRAYLGHLLDALPDGSEVLELGCGAGIPVTRELATRHRVTAVDISAAQLELARRHVPAATFLQADMAELRLPRGSFDAVCAFYSIVHVPRERHRALLASVRVWLRPGGLFVFCLGSSDNPAEEDGDWLGAPMFFSHYEAGTSLRLVRDAGFEVEGHELLPQVEHGVEGSCLWVVARR